MTEATTSRIARITGLAYLGIIFSGIFGEFLVRMALVEPGDAATTTINIAGAESWFRAALAADLLMIALDIGVAVGLYVLLRPVHAPLARLAAALRLIQAAVLGANLMNMAAALRWATQAAAGATGSEVARSMVLGSMELHRVVYDLGLVFFGFACLVLGHLLRVSGLVPKLLGVGLMLAGVVYLLGSFSVVLAPEFAPIIDPLYVLTLVSELALAAWLSIKGIWSPSRAQRASAEFA